MLGHGLFKCGSPNKSLIMGVHWHIRWQSGRNGIPKDIFNFVN